jgi:hypothetical protein
MFYYYHPWVYRIIIAAMAIFVILIVYTACKNIDDHCNGKR